MVRWQRSRRRGGEGGEAGIGDECERARSAQALQTTRHVLSTFVQSVPVSAVMTDRDSRVLRIYAGTNEIMKLVIARSL